MVCGYVSSYTRQSRNGVTHAQSKVQVQETLPAAQLVGIGGFCTYIQTDIHLHARSHSLTGPSPTSTWATAQAWSS